MANNSEQTNHGNTLWFLARLAMVLVIAAVGIDYLYPMLPYGLQDQVLKFKDAGLNHLVETFERVNQQ